MTALALYLTAGWLIAMVGIELSVREGNPPRSSRPRVLWMAFKLGFVWLPVLGFIIVQRLRNDD